MIPLLQASFFAASELTLLSRQAGDKFQDIIWASREAERRQTLPEDQCIEVSLGAWPFKRFETAEIIPIRKGK